MKYKSLALAAAALMVGTLSFGSAEAANVMSGSGAPTGITKMQDGNIQAASHRKWRRHWRRHHGFRRHSGVFLGLGFAPLFYSPYYDEPYYYRGGGHVRWCFDHYRTYDPRSNTFRGYDGYLHQCRSPYRY